MILKVLTGIPGSMLDAGSAVSSPAQVTLDFAGVELGLAMQARSRSSSHADASGTSLDAAAFEQLRSFHCNFTALTPPHLLTEQRVI